MNGTERRAVRRLIDRARRDQLKITTAESWLYDRLALGPARFDVLVEDARAQAGIGKSALRKGAKRLHLKVDARTWTLPKRR